MKYVTDRSFADPDKAARKLLEIVLSKDIDGGQYTYAGVTNTAFLQAGGNVAEYLASRDCAGLVRDRPIRHLGRPVASGRGPLILPPARTPRPGQPAGRVAPKVRELAR
jgi:hypothetical protein